MRADRMIRVVAVAAAVMAAPARDARADYDPEVRDGCPAGNLSRKPDVQQRASDTLEPYRGTRPDQVGALPQADSALAPNQLAVDVVVSHFASQGNDSGPTALYGGALYGHLDRPFARWLQARWAIGLGVAGSAHQLEEGPDRRFRLGTLVFEPELRAQWVATGTNVVNSLDDPEHQAAGLRNGIAVQGIFAAPLDTSMGARADSARVWRRDAFEGYLVSPRATMGGAVELRSEGVGCYAPFVHLRLSATATKAETDPARPSVEHLVLLAPQTLTFGFSPSSSASLLTQYGLLVYFTEDTARGSSASLIGASAIHRFRIGGERVVGRVTFAAHFDFFLGSPLYGGTMFTVAMRLNPGDWK